MTRKLHVWRSQLLTQLVETKRLMKKDKRKKKKLRERELSVWIFLHILFFCR